MAVVDFGEEATDPMDDSGRRGDELQAFLGASTTRGRAEGRLELRASRSFGASELGIYVGALAGTSVRLADMTSLRASVELPLKAADRLRWRTSLSVAQRF